MNAISLRTLGSLSSYALVLISGSLLGKTKPGIPQDLMLMSSNFSSGENTCSLPHRSPHLSYWGTWRRDAAQEGKMMMGRQVSTAPAYFLLKIWTIALEEVLTRNKQAYAYLA